MSSKVRCESSRIKTMDLTFASTDRVAGTFEWISAIAAIVHFLDDVDISVDTVGAVAYEVEDIVVPKQAGTAWVIGDRLFYSPGGNTFHKATTSVVDVIAGMALEAAGSAAIEGRAHFVGDAGRRPQMSGAGS